MAKITKHSNGTEKLFKDHEMNVKMVKNDIMPKAIKCKENFGQTMMTDDFDHAKRPWKPMGRK